MHALGILCRCLFRRPSAGIAGASGDQRKEGSPALRQSVRQPQWGGTCLQSRAQSSDSWSAISGQILDWFQYLEANWSRTELESVIVTMDELEMSRRCREELEMYEEAEFDVETQQRLDCEVDKLLKGYDWTLSPLANKWVGSSFTNIPEQVWVKNEVWGRGYVFVNEEQVTDRLYFRALKLVLLNSVGRQILMLYSAISNTVVFPSLRWYLMDSFWGLKAFLTDFQVLLTLWYYLKGSEKMGLCGFFPTWPTPHFETHYT